MEFWDNDTGQDKVRQQREVYDNQKFSGVPENILECPVGVCIPGIIFKEAPIKYFFLPLPLGEGA
jgi:hypothetical protein